MPLPMNDVLTTRDLTRAERHLTRWMLEHGEPDALPFLAQLERARVTSWRCPCGCASINFAVEGQPAPAGGLHLLGDFVFGGEADLSGIFVFEQGGVLSGVEVYAMASEAPQLLPAPDILRPLPVATPST